MRPPSAANRKPRHRSIPSLDDNSLVQGGVVPPLTRTFHGMGVRPRVRGLYQVKVTGNFVGTLSVTPALSPAPYTLSYP